MFIRFLIIFLISSLITVGHSQNESTIIVDDLTKSQATDKVKALSQKCWSLREANSDSALIIGKQALQLAKKYEITKEIPNLNGYIGVILIHYLYDIKGSIPYFQESLKGSLEINDSIRIGYSYNNLGDVYMLTGNIPLALQFSERSLAIFKNIENNMGIAYGYINLGLIYRVEKKYDIALDYFEKARDLRKQIGDSTGYASSILEIAKTYQEQGNIDLAMENYMQSMARHSEIKNKRYMAFCLNGIGGIYYLKENYEKALESYMNAIKLNESRMSYFGLVENYIGIALVYAKENEIRKGEDALFNALEISNRLGLHSSILRVYESYAEFYSILNDYSKATESLSKFLILYDSIYSLQQFEILNAIEANFVMRQSLYSTNQELSTRRTELIYLIIIIVLMVIIFSILIWRFVAQKELNNKLREANITKDKLFSVISHDLRSPFNTILGFSELLMEELRSGKNDNAIEYAKAVYSVSGNTFTMVNNLLTWSRAQNGTIAFNPSMQSVESLFDEIRRVFIITTGKNNLKLVINNNVDRVVLVDNTLLNIIITNLISNAIKYTEPGGEIQLSSRIVKNYLIFEVRDTGIGMTKQTCNVLFTDNSKIKSTRGVRNESGTGLGLMICKDLIDIHKGTIIAESVLGEGSTFTIKLPV